MIVKGFKSEALIKYEYLNETGRFHGFLSTSAQRSSIHGIPCLTCYIKLLSKYKYVVYSNI